MASISAEPGVGLSKEGGVGDTIPVGNSAFDYDEPLCVEDSICARYQSYKLPLGGVTSNQAGPYEFLLEDQGRSYLMMGDLKLYVRCKIVKQDGTACGAEDVVAPINNLGVGMWSSVETTLNDTNISGPTSNYSNYKAHLETLLSYEGDARDTHLVGQLFKMDTPARYELFTRDGENQGFNGRFFFTQLSREFEMVSVIQSDFSRATKMLAPGNRLMFKFYRAPDSFCLCTMSDNVYKLQIVDMRLYYTRITLKESIPEPLIEKYPLSKTIMKRKHFSRGSVQEVEFIQHSGPIPKQIIIAFVKTSSFEGNFKRNPFFFPHFSLQKLALKVNDMTVGGGPLEPNFDSETPLISREYIHLFANSGTYRTDRGCCISWSAFANGSTIFPFDLTPDFCNGHHLHSSQTGSISIDLAWRNELEEPVTMLVYSQFDGVLYRQEDDMNFSFKYI